MIREGRELAEGGVPDPFPPLGFEANRKQFEIAVEWALEQSGEVIDLGDSAFMPDFVLRRDDGARVFLELLGFWTPEHLRERLLEFDHARIKNFILAAWDELRGSRDPLTNVPPNTIVFKRSLDPSVVALMAEQLVSRASGGGG